MPKQQKSPGKWWSDGIRFSCQGSGRCCVSHGEFGFVYLTLEDRKRAAKSLNLTLAVFTKKHCIKEDGLFRLTEQEGGGPCQFLQGKSCGIYEGRPTQCRTWPFWPEVMSAKAWKAEVAAFCPGVGKGKLWSEQEIDLALAEQIRSESAL